MILRSPTEDEDGGISLHRIWTPFPLMGKGRDRGAPEPIKPITPTFVLPRRGEGQRALPPVGFFISRPLAQPQTQFSKEITKAGGFEPRPYIFIFCVPCVLCGYVTSFFVLFVCVWLGLRRAYLGPARLFHSAENRTARCASASAGWTPRKEFASLV